MTELPRYSTNAIVMMEIDDDLDDEEQPLATDPHGDWVKWGDVSFRLQQLEEQLSAKEATRQLLEADVQQLEQEKANLLDMHCVSETNASNLERRAQIAAAALAETREALQQLLSFDVIRNAWDKGPCDEGWQSDALVRAIAKAEELARVDKQADSLSVVPQPRVGDTSTDR